MDELGNDSVKRNSVIKALAHQRLASNNYLPPKSYQQFYENLACDSESVTNSDEK